MRSAVLTCVYDATRLQAILGTRSATSLRACYAMPGTDLVYAPTRKIQTILFRTWVVVHSQYRTARY
eukprot:3933161-Rhodomonas_salina.3